MKRIVLAAGAVAITALFVSAAAAQHHRPNHAGASAVNSGQANGPFGLLVHGAFQRMMHMQDFSAKVQLKSVILGGATEAVGAAAGLRGEITAIDGKLLLTYGRPCPACGHAGQEHATLLVSAKVSSWHDPAILPKDLARQALDSWILEQATLAGLDPTKPFPVRLKGILTDVKMHVIGAPNPNFKGHGEGHGAGHAMASQQDITAEKIEGEIVGFYAPPDAQGIISHPGEPFHYHWVDTGRTRTAHLDDFGLAKGGQLLLPKN